MPEPQDQPAWLLVVFVFICLGVVAVWITLKQNGFI